MRVGVEKGRGDADGVGGGGTETGADGERRADGESLRWAVLVGVKVSGEQLIPP